MPSVAHILKPHHRRRLLRRLIVGAILVIGALAIVLLIASLWRILFNADWDFPIGITLVLATVIGAAIAWQTRPTLFQTALHLDFVNQTGELFSSALNCPGDLQFASAVQSRAVALSAKIKPEPFVLLKKLGVPVVLVLAMSLALSIWPTAPKSSAGAADTVKTNPAQQIPSPISPFRPTNTPRMPDPVSDSPTAPLFAPTPMPGKGFSASDPTPTQQIAPGAVPRIETGVGTAEGFPTQERSSKPASWRNGKKSQEGPFTDPSQLPPGYDDILERYFSREE